MIGSRTVKLDFLAVSLLIFASSAFGDPIHDAIRLDDLSKTRMLLQGDPTLATGKDSDGGTLLHFVAVVSGNKDIVQLLLANKADIEAKMKGGVTPLHVAAGNGRKEMTQLLLASGAKVSARDDEGWMPLHYAAQSGQRDVAELLLARGADVNAGNDNGTTPLLFAASKGHRDVVELLLAKGADVNGRDKEGITPLNIATVKQHPDVAELLRQHGAVSPDVNTRAQTAGSLFDAIEKHDAEKTKTLIAGGADINARNAKGIPALVLAAEVGDSEATTLLLHAGAAIDARDRENNATALFWAAIYGRYEIAKLLVEKGADLNVKANGGVAPLFAAVLGCQKAPVSACIAVADLLLKKGVDVNVMTEKGITPYMYASGTRSTPREMADFLEAHGGR